MSRKQPIIYSGVFDLGAMPFFSARPFSGEPCQHRVAFWCASGEASLKSTTSVGCQRISYVESVLTDDGEAIAWLLDGEKGGAP